MRATMLMKRKHGNTKFTSMFILMLLMAMLMVFILCLSILIQLNFLET
ncbi:hypothetical protein Godav_006534, partial [Gossypium davidsonii]|nr:hypothetical protein [Gossypium davidsonii]